MSLPNPGSYDRVSALEREVRREIELIYKELSEIRAETTEIHDAVGRVQNTCDQHRQENRDRTDALREAMHADSLKLRNALIAFIGAIVLGLVPVIVTFVLLQ